ncbi:hypothetical protein [Bradyrhizobium sp. CB3481]|uniref:hypothetical protein n=1 Tax=Bradyrhizobium sp. CB3481 TaxID=3039158 RepID=UPI0024B0B910|nr:hypothetical protein [Bradyrhizobium sp. CB3481]WFU14696.1 hypothetical protein QA643_26930 [Bradyrhizobium sp. CB3481]
MAQIPRRPSGTGFSRIVIFFYRSVADIAFIIAILFAVGFASGLIMPKTIDVVPHTCTEALAVDGHDGSVCHSTQRHGAQALQRLLETICAEAH